MRGHFCCSHEGEIVTLVLDKVNTLHAAGIAGLEQNVPDTLEIIVKAVLDGPCTPCRGDQRIRARRTGDLGAFRRRLKAVADRLELRRRSLHTTPFHRFLLLVPFAWVFTLSQNMHIPHLQACSAARARRLDRTNNNDQPRR